MEQLLAEIAALKAAQTAAPAPAAAAPAPAAPAAAPAEQPIYNEQEQTTLTKYQTEWPDVAAGEALIRRSEYRQLAGYIFGQIGPLLDELRAQVTPAATHTTYTQLKGMVSDYDDVRDPCLEWAAKQPAALKAAYQDIADRGTPEDVAAMIETFRKATGWKKPTSAAPAALAAPAAPAASPAAAPAAPAAPAVSPAVAAAAASLAPVASARTAQTAGADPNDFDGAFAEASKALSV
jgi:pyruvate dehydrogenase E2 component (dihydrolipoamide acetyltransferase)